MGTVKMDIIEIRKNAYSKLGVQYIASNRNVACILFVLEIIETYSLEFTEILNRVKKLDVETNKHTLIQQDYFRKFIRTTNLKSITLANLVCGDILLINEYSKERQIDHIGLYLGEGEYIHLKRNNNKGDFAEILKLDDNRHKIIWAVRGEIS